MATIKDIAKEAGVSIATVSNVINRTKFVSEPIRERVLRAIENQGYVANPLARGMKSHNSKLIGVVLSQLDMSFFPQVLQGIQEGAMKYGYRILIQDSMYNQKTEVDCIRALLSTNVDGILLNSVAASESETYFRFLSSLSSGGRKIPLVSMERDLTYYSIDSVCQDNTGGAVIATRHLLESGCKQLLHITGPKSFTVVNERVEGFRRVMQTESAENNVFYGNFTASSGYNSTYAALKRGYRFDGIFCGSDAIALGVIKALTEFSTRCPEDVKVAGFDNSYFASLVSPSLTTIHVPQIGIGQRSVELLINRIRDENPSPARMIEMPVRLVVRHSTDPHKPDAWEL